jgi:hypothetical protein
MTKIEPVLGGTGSVCIKNIGRKKIEAEHLQKSDKMTS